MSNLPLEWFDLVVPKRNQVYIQRDERPTVARGVIIPESVAAARKAYMGVVLRVGAGVTELAPGDRVLLASGAGKKLEFGQRGERVIEAVSPGQVMAKIPDVDVAENKGEHYRRGIGPEELDELTRED